MHFLCPVQKSLRAMQFVDYGKLKRIRGLAYATRCSPQMANRMVEKARGFLNQLLPDVFIFTDVYKGAESGKYERGYCRDDRS